MKEDKSGREEKVSKLYREEKKGYFHMATFSLFYLHIQFLNKNTWK